VLKIGGAVARSSTRAPLDYKLLFLPLHYTGSLEMSVNINYIH
jgi:hypothetical protein